MEKRMWCKVEKKMADWCKEFREEIMGMWEYEAKEWQQKIEERDLKIKELEEKLKLLRKTKESGEIDEQGGDEEDSEVESEEKQETEGETMEEVISQRREEWAKVVKKRKMKRDEVVEALNDFKVKKKLLKVTKETVDQKKRENNIVVKGWEEVETTGWNEVDKNEAKRWGQAVISKCVQAEVIIEDAEWYGNGEKKVLVVKMKNWKDKSEVMKNRGKLKGTKIYLDNELTREERNTLIKLLRWKRWIKRSNFREGREIPVVWIRKESMKVDGEWYSLEKLREIMGCDIEELEQREETEMQEDKDGE